jgi:uncharacterized protein
MKVWGFVVFIIIVLSVYSLVNYYIYTRGLQSLVSSALTKFIFKFGFIFLAASYVIARFLEKFWLSPVSNFFSWIGAFWLAAMVYFFIIVLIIDIFRIADYFFHFFPAFITNNPAKAKSVAACISMGVVAIILVLGHINAINPDIKTLEIKIDKKAGKYKTLNVVMVSDVHMGSLINKNRIRKLVDRINMLNPDVVLMAGDLVDEDLQPVIRYNLGNKLMEINSKLGTFAVTGNHEYIGGAEDACIYLNQHGIKMVRDTALLIDSSFYIVGRDDQAKNRFAGSGRKALPDILQGIDISKPLIMMDHTPFKLEEAMKNGIDLQVSGHTHHGQLFPFNLITKKIYELSWGYLQKENTHYYVSSGFGGWGPPVRTGNKPEIVNIKISFK